jgi:hypothetical protein
MATSGFCPPSAKRQVATLQQEPGRDWPTYAMTADIPDFGTVNPGYLLEALVARSGLAAIAFVTMLCLATAALMRRGTRCSISGV